VVAAMEVLVEADWDEAAIADGRADGVDLLRRIDLLRFFRTIRSLQVHCDEVCILSIAGQLKNTCHL
jgi:hypothetical protein